MTHLASKTCEPCREGAQPLQATDREALLTQLADGWRVVDGKKLERNYRFDDFKAALDFTVRVGDIAEEQGHHPDICLSYGKVQLEVWTHKVDGLTESDFVFAAKVDQLR